MKVLLALALIASISACSISPRLDVGMLHDYSQNLKGGPQMGYVDLQLFTCADWILKCSAGLYHMSPLFAGVPVNKDEQGVIEGPYLNVTIFEL